MCVRGFGVWLVPTFNMAYRRRYYDERERYNSLSQKYTMTKYVDDYDYYDSHYYDEFEEDRGYVTPPIDYSDGEDDKELTHQDFGIKLDQHLGSQRSSEKRKRSLQDANIGQKQQHFNTFELLVSHKKNLNKNDIRSNKTQLLDLVTPPIDYSDDDDEKQEDTREAIANLCKDATTIEAKIRNWREKSSLAGQYDIDETVNSVDERCNEAINESLTTENNVVISEQSTRQIEDVNMTGSFSASRRNSSIFGLECIVEETKASLEREREGGKKNKPKVSFSKVREEIYHTESESNSECSESEEATLVPNDINDNDNSSLDPVDYYSQPLLFTGLQGRREPRDSNVSSLKELLPDILEIDNEASQDEDRDTPEKKRTVKTVKEIKDWISSSVRARRKNGHIRQRSYESLGDIRYVHNIGRGTSSFSQWLVRKKFQLRKSCVKKKTLFFRKLSSTIPITIEIEKSALKVGIIRVESVLFLCDNILTAIAEKYN